jgi:hypothetical protein
MLFDDLCIIYRRQILYDLRQASDSGYSIMSSRIIDAKQVANACALPSFNI